jgi:hypothetical protein
MSLAGVSGPGAQRMYSASASHMVNVVFAATSDSRPSAWNAAADRRFPLLRGLAPVLAGYDVTGALIGLAGVAFIMSATRRVLAR